MVKLAFLAGLGGFLGSAGRYLSQQYILNLLPWTFPAGTFIVNIAGCFLIGIFYGLAANEKIASMEWRLFFTSGFCGGFTTFSAFSYENILLIQEGNIKYAIWYSALSLLVGFSATILGLYIIRGSIQP